MPIVDVAWVGCLRRRYLRPQEAGGFSCFDGSGSGMETSRSVRLSLLGKRALHSVCLEACKSGGTILLAGVCLAGPKRHICGRAPLIFAALFWTDRCLTG